MTTLIPERGITNEAAPSLPTLLRLLILEDNPLDLELCLQELKKAKFDILADAVDTDEAFTEKLGSSPYDLILSDYRLPSWSGIAAYRVLKQSGKDIPFILVTGTLGEEAAVDLIKEGISDYILKDRLARLPAAIRRALAEKAIRDERERVLQALRESEERVRLLLDSTAEAIVGIDEQGHCTFTNPACVRMLGYDTPIDLLGKQMHRMFHHTRANGRPYPKQECPIHVAFHKGEGAHVDDEVFWRKDRSSFPVEYWSYPVFRDGKTIGSVITFLDITERKRAERSIRKSEARVRHLLESSIIGISSDDLNGRIVDANDAFLKLLGYTRSELLAGELRWENMSPPEYHQSDQQTLEQLKKNGVVAPKEKEFLHKDGSRIPVLIGVTTITSAEGEAEAISFVVDISERKGLEQQLRQAQKMEAIGQLAGGIAHDFNNLLGVIIGYADILLDQLTPDQQLHKDAEQIKKAGDRAALLTRQLLAFSRKQVLQPMILDLNTILADTEKFLRRLIGEDIELIVVPGPALGRVKADPGQMEQIILNLAVNARDAMPKGGKLTIETKNLEMDHDFARQHAPALPGRYVVLVVRDTGCGMDAQTQAHIFEPFFTTKGLGKGTGLGLSTVYGVVKQSNGFIWVESKPGQGAAFKIYLPYSEQSVLSERPSDKASGVLKGSETILVVEDDADLRVLTRRSLQEAGCAVLEAENPAKALAMSANYKGPVHLMVTDVIMPGMSGRELAKCLAPHRPEMKVLYVSGYTDDAIVQHGMLEAGLAFLQKPFSPKSLVRQVRNILDAGLRKAKEETAGSQTIEVPHLK